MRKNSNSYMRNRSRRCSKKALIFFFSHSCSHEKTWCSKVIFFFSLLLNSIMLLHLLKHRHTSEEVHSKSLIDIPK